MQFFSRLSLRLAAHPVVRGISAYVGGELVARLSRLAAVVVIARHVSPVMMGTAALCLSLFEIIRVLANAGIGQRIVAASDAELASVCNGADRLFRAWCPIVTLLQLGVAGGLAIAGQREAATMLAVLSTVYLMMPFGLVRVFLLMRDGRLGTTARIGSLQTITDHFLTAVLVLLAPGAWALVLPKLLTTPLWVLLVRRARSWRPAIAAPMSARHFLRFGSGVIVGELVTAARSQCDNLIIGALLGVNALGTYYFAFGAGLGITYSFVSATQIVLFPFICGASGAGRHQRFVQGAAVSAAILLPVVGTQILLAPLYVPLVFGAHWAMAAPLVSLLGLAAFPLLLGAVATARMRAGGKAVADAGISTIATLSALGGLALGASQGLAIAVIGYVLGLTIILLPYFIWNLANRPHARGSRIEEYAL